ncbi:MAG TPA: eight-cysteine-cluster domain-containing protein [Nitrospirae bacterium]|nr:eight-cysteine-cluster domain-containing protein [Nitrospirota bacterium]
MTRTLPFILLAGIALSFSIFVSDGCARPSSSNNNRTEDGGFCGESTKAVCSAGTDCIVGGCSSQVCQGANEPPIITTCEWTECYDAEKYNKACGCVESQCQWRDK